MCTKTIDPIYMFLGLPLVIPGVAFLCLAFLAGKNKLKSSLVVLSAILIPIFLIGSFFYIFILGMSTASVTVTNASRYERTMRLSGNSNKDLLANFPKTIPDDSTDVVFYYGESLWQDYSLTVILRFTTNKELIEEYSKQLKKVATKAESANNANIESIYDQASENYINNLSADYIIYTILNEGNYDKKVCAVAISQEQNNIIFYAYETC